MNFKTTLVLVILLAIVGAYVFFIGRDATPTYEIEDADRAAGTQQGEPLFADGALEPDAVMRVTISRGDEMATFEKADGKWMQVEPARFPADATKLDGLVRSAAELRYVDRVTPGAAGQPTLKELALDPARATVTLIAGETQHVIGVGRKSTGGRGYVSLGETKEAYVVGDALQSVLFTRDRLASWRRKSLGAPAATELDSITVTTSAADVSAAKRDGKWYLGEGTGERASEEAVADLVRNVGYLSARDFVSDAPEALATYGLDQPRMTITLRQATAGEGEAATVSTLRIGNAADAKEETVYATWTQGPAEAPASSVVFTLPKGTVDQLAKSPDDLRAKSLVAVKNAADVTSIQVAPASGDAVSLQRDGGAWRFAEPGPGFSADTAAVNDLLDTILTAEAERFEPAPEGAEPAATVTLGVAGRDQPETVRLFPASGEAEATHWLAVREGERVAGAVPKERLARVLVPAVAMRAKSVLELRPDAITAAKSEHPGGATYSFTKTDGTWALQGAEAFESADFERFLGEASSLSAESWVTDGRTAGDSPLVLTLQLPEGTRTLRVDPETRVAELDGLDAPFVVSPAFLEALTREYRDRTAVGLTIDQIRQVVLTRGGESITIGRGDDGQYTSEGAASGEIDQTRAAAVFDTLAGLRVERWLDAPRGEESASGIGIEFTPVQGDPRKLTVYPAGDAGVLGAGAAGRWFVLDDADVAKLVAPIAPEEAAKAEASGEELLK